MRLRVHVVLVLLLFLGWRPVARAQLPLGVMGDSLSDEYYEGVATYATNWVQQLARFRGLNLGPTATTAAQPGGTWGEPRRTGNQYNWARSGATAATLLADGQHTGVAAQVTNSGVTNVVLEIGSNDFNPVTGTVYVQIYNNSWSTAQVSNYVAQVLTNIETALVTVKATGARVVLVNVLDFGLTPTVSLLYGNSGQRDRVSLVLTNLNTQLKNLGQKYQVPVVDFFGLEHAAFGVNTSLKSTLKVGNVTINMRLASSSAPSTAAVVGDGAHPHTVLQGVLANLMLQGFNAGYGTGVPLFTEREILTNAGLAYGGSDTLASQIGSYTNYVFLPLRPSITNFRTTSTNVVLGFTTSDQNLYTIEACTNFSANIWSTLTNHVRGTGGTLTYTNVGPPLPAKFYRVRVE